MFHEGYNRLGIVQIVEVTTKMTNDPPVTNQQRHLQCRSNDQVCSNGSQCIIYLHNAAWVDGLYSELSNSQNDCEDENAGRRRVDFGDSMQVALEKTVAGWHSMGRGTAGSQT